MDSQRDIEFALMKAVRSAETTTRGGVLSSTRHNLTTCTFRARKQGNNQERKIRGKGCTRLWRRSLVNQQPERIIVVRKTDTVYLHCSDDCSIIRSIHQEGNL